MIQQLAKVNSFGLNISDRLDILTINLHVNYEEGGGQNILGFCLDSPNKEKKERFGTAYGCEMIRRLMMFFNVDEFNNAKGTLFYVLGEGEGLSFNPLGMKTLKAHGKQKELIFQDIYDQMDDE